MPEDEKMLRASGTTSVANALGQRVELSKEVIEMMVEQPLNVFVPLKIEVVK